MNKRVATLAPTGLAASHLDGVTVNSFFGIGVPVKKSDFKKMWSEKSKKRLQALDVLLIDEISMLSGEMFDCLCEQYTQLKQYTEFKAAIDRFDQDCRSLSKMEAGSSDRVEDDQDYPLSPLLQKQRLLSGLSACLPWGGIQVVS